MERDLLGHRLFHLHYNKAQHNTVLATAGCKKDGQKKGSFYFFIR